MQASQRRARLTKQPSKKSQAYKATQEPGLQSSLALPCKATQAGIQSSPALPGKPGNHTHAEKPALHIRQYISKACHDKS